ncbi:Ig-like domain-containing protein, partial [Carnobacterium maltaromaticum]|uniref:Ig-like domain-containing protein n=1 Tax=Carnobacterium maltaromaticum TaxID=2751 RepID=UPI00191BABD0
MKAQVIAPPTIQEYYTTDASAKGLAPGGNKVRLYVNGKAIRTAGVNSDGSYSIYTGDQVSLMTAGNTFQISTLDAAGNESGKTTGTVKVKVQVLAPPTIQPYVTTDSIVRGKAAVGSKQVVLYVNGRAVRTAAVNTDGSYSIYTGDQLQLMVAGTTFQISSRDAAGNESLKTIGLVLAALAAPVIAPYHSSDVYTTGTVPAEATRVALYIDGKLIRYAPVTAGKFSLYTGNQASLQTAGKVFQLAAVDAKGTIGTFGNGVVLENDLV